MFVCCSILNSVVIVLFLSGMVAMIMLRTLHKDIARYNQMDDSVWLSYGYFILRDCRKSQQKMAKNTANFYKNHGKNTASNQIPETIIQS